MVGAWLRLFVNSAVVAACAVAAQLGAGDALGIIRWDGPHPAARLPDDGFELLALAVTHPDPDRVTRLLAAVGFAGPVTVVAGGTPKLAAEIRTPAGVRWL